MIYLLISAVILVIEGFVKFTPWKYESTLKKVKLK